MATRAQIIAAARTYLGTPFHHQGRVRGVGVDCVGLLVGVARDTGTVHQDFTDYSRYPDGKTLDARISASMDLIRLEEVKPGDALVFRLIRHPCHVGILTFERTLIHTFSGVGKVVEHGFTMTWRNRLCGAYRYRGLD